MRLHVTDINWDTDGRSAKKIGLPSELFLEDGEVDDVDDVADWLSDKFGFCVFGCQAKRVDLEGRPIVDGLEESTSGPSA